MMVLRIILLALILLVIPVVVGSVFSGVDKRHSGVCFMWVSGQMLLWAGFELIAVPLILIQRTFSLVAWMFSFYTLGLLFLAVFIWIYGRRKKHGLQMVRNKTVSLQKRDYFLWIVFGVLLALQLIFAVVLAYEEGDDAFYVAVSTITADADTMYRTLPYTGLYTEVDIRHGLAPFPIWIAYLTRVSGIEAVTLAQIVVPLVFLLMTYTVYYQIGSVLLAKCKSGLPLFMVMMELLVLFGGYSTYSAENFLLVRTAQGKAVLCNIVIPFLLLLFYMLLERLQNQQKIGAGQWILMTLTMIAGCLCSSLSPLLICMLTGVVGICAALCYKRWKILCPMALCCVMPIGFALLYFVYG